MSLSLSAEPASQVEYLPEPGLQPLGPMTAATTPSVAQRVVGGTSALGLGVVIERGAGFLANILAARLGGPATFGAYSLAISTANQISTYAAGGIGATAVRFSGKYPHESPSYSNLARSLVVVSAVSAVLAAAALTLGAGPLAHLLGKSELTGLLRWASLSAAGIILLECARGFFVGQRRLIALVLLSVLVGAGMVCLLPAAARHHQPVRMIVLQGCITTGAVLVCLSMAKPLKLLGKIHVAGKGVPIRVMLREVWSFGLVQLAGLVGANVAGWWLMTLVARSDTSLTQMSFFAIGSQLRNLAGIVPGLLTEGSYAVMADPGGEAQRTPHKVMAMCSFASLTVSLGLASLGIIAMPWALKLLYGTQYASAALTVSVGLAIAVVHMGNAPAAARLTIVSIGSTGVINTIWAVLVAAAATSFLFFGGDAARAMLIYFAAHVVSSALVLLTLARRDGLPAGMIALYALSTSMSTAMVGLAFARAGQPGQVRELSGVMLALALATLAGLWLMARHYGWLPAFDTLRARFLRRRAHV